MHFASFFTKVLTVASLALADDSSTTPSETAIVSEEPKYTTRFHPKPTLNAEQISKLSTYESDLNSLRSSIHTNPLYTSLTAALATITAPHYGEATTTSRKHHKSNEVAEWYSELPSDLQSFVSSNRAAKSSLFSKDLGETTAKRHNDKTTATGIFDLGEPSVTMMTGTKGPASTAQPANAQVSAASASATGDKGATSEAPNPWKLAGATILTVFMAGLTAALLL